MHTYSRNITKVILMALVTVLIGACAKPSEPPKPAYKGELILWVAPGLAGYPAASGINPQWLEERAAAYGREGISIQVERFGSPADLEKALRAPDWGGRRAPDLVLGRFLPDTADRLAPVDPGDQYLPNAVDAFRYGSEVLGLPALLEVQVLALNEEAFGAAGATLPADGAWNLETFESALKQLSANGRHGLGFAYVPGAPDWWPLIDGVLSRDGALAPGAVPGLEGLHRYRKEGWLHPDTGKLNAEDTWALFAKQPAAFAVMPVSAWAVPLLRSEPYNVKLSVAGFPGAMTVGHTYGFMFPRQTDPLRLEAAMDLARFIAAPDRQVELARLSGLVPAHRRAQNPFNGDAAMTRVFGLATQQRPLPPDLADKLGDMPAAQELRLALLGARQPAPALQEVLKALTSATTPAK